MTPPLWWFLLLTLPLFGGGAIAATAFIAAELEAMRDVTDDRFTLSEYFWWATRTKWYWWIILKVSGSALCAGIIVLGVWLFGHWIVEAW